MKVLNKRRFKRYFGSFSKVKLCKGFQQGFGELIKRKFVLERTILIRIILTWQADSVVRMVNIFL